MLRDVLGNRYVTSDLLGAGGMAEVFLAHDPILGRDVALKILREYYAEDTEFVGRFRREAQSAAALNHPNVVQVYDQGCAEDGRYYIAMEHVPGGNLKDLILRRGPLDPAEAARIACQVAEALRAAHERGIVHRDIKPQNVLVDEVRDAKVADFGIALAASRSSSRSSTSGTNQVFGTASYMSPEQAMGERVGPQSDLYSLGVVLYEMLTGVVPFAAEGPLATAMKHVTEQPLPPRKRNPSIPEDMDALVMGLLAKKPEDRYPSAAELTEDLRRVREGLPPAFAGAAGYSETVRSPAVAAVPVPANTEGGTRPGSRPSKPRRRRYLGAGLVALVALAALLALSGGLGWGASRPPERVSAVRSAEGDTLEAPESLTGTPGNDAGKGTSSGTGSADLGGGASAASPSASASVPASASASSSAAASAPAESEPPVSKPRAPDRAPEPRAVATQAPAPHAAAPHAAAPFSSAPVSGGPSDSGGRDAGAGTSGGGGSAAQEQY